VLTDNQEILLAEYKANVDLWQHDDNLRQKRTTTFLAVNLALFGIVAFVIKESALVGEWTTIASGSAVMFGIVICVVWFLVQARSEQYLRFRRRQLAEIEGKLGASDTFTKQYAAISLGEPVTFVHSKEGPFIRTNVTSVSSSKLEAVLPLAMILVWIIIAVFVAAKVDKAPQAAGPASSPAGVTKSPPQSN
jgi:hypothetical protein